MATAYSSPENATAPAGVAATGPTVLRVSVWQAPLVPVALALTAGVVTDRYAHFPLGVSLLVAAAAVAAWMATRAGRQPGLALIYLGIAAVAAGAGYHHWRREVFPPDDIGHYTTSEPQPAQLRGVLEEEPVVNRQPADDPLQSIPRQESTVAVVRVASLKRQHDWVAVSGLARLSVAGHWAGCHVGDEVELVGRLFAPPGPANPGQADMASSLLDQRIRAQVVVRNTPLAVTLLRQGWPSSFHGWLAVVRGWGQETLARTLPADTSGVATALVLGEGAAMAPADWEQYRRSGVVHVLAISGLHLIVLAGFLWFTLRLLGISRRRGAWLVAVFLLLYALLAGGRPPALRAAIMVCAACGGLYVRRQALSANTLALAWITVGLLNPMNLFGAGCQLSFLAVAVLHWGRLGRSAPEADPLARLVEESRPAWQQAVRALGRWAYRICLITAAVWLAQAPLVASRYHLVSPVAIIIGPPAVLLMAVALIAGFLLLVTAALCPLLVPVFAWVTRLGLTACDSLVDVSGRLAGGHWYVGTVPEWWLWGFYVGLFALLTIPAIRQRWRWVAAAGLVWACLGLAGHGVKAASSELRCTFLAVGHGGCAVLETPDGRTLLYDTGALGGPDVTRRQIAPFLWDRGIHRIDEVFLSHADLDHFNGLVPLMDRFAVGQVTCTPTFADKATRGVRLTLEAIGRRGIPVRVIRAGDRLSVGELDMEVLHPPARGPEGNENARSLVLLVRHAGHCLLLTGDLEGPGLVRVLKLPPRHVDVLMAPHHGSRVANRRELAEWARPAVVVACQGPPQWLNPTPDPYTARGAEFLGTWPHGAVTVRSRRGELTVDTFQTQRQFVIRDQR
ncbi:MAG TPA: ComEC/Rec2 family competence protein [Gemmataceae bacterium]|jgi:competence protein ComEC|nr:ComEC/Rec2 family competence protein [Gemmataceae bacterium]